MTEQEKKALRTLSRNDLINFSIYTDRKFTPTWLHEEIAGKLMAVERGEIKRLMIFVPPRHGKSELSSIKFPAWYLGRHPESEIITSSYSAELAQDFGYKTRSLVSSQEYARLFSTTLKEDSKGKAKWLTDKNGSYTAVGVGGPITGRGADICIIDDPLKNREEAESKTIRAKVWSWYTSTLYTRLEKGGSIILILTRWHTDDLAGRLLQKMKDGEGEDWEVVRFPAVALHDEEHRKTGDALWPEKYNLDDLDRIKIAVGAYDWSALYQQEPVTSETLEFKQEYWQYKTIEEVEALQSAKYLTIDTAISQRDSADFTGYCMNFVDSRNYWNLKAWKSKESPLDLIDNLFALHARYKFSKIGIEKTVYLQAIKPFLDQEMRKRNIFLPIVELHHNQTAKEVRIRGLLPRYQSRSIIHIKGHCVDLEEQEMQFPFGIHDDVLDAAAYQLQIVSGVGGIEPHKRIQQLFKPTSYR